MDNEMYKDEDFIMISAALVLCLNVLLKYKIKNRSIWVIPYLAQRKFKGRFFEDLRKNPKMFEENFHVTVEQFDYIYKRTEKYLSGVRNTRPNDKIGPKEKLAAGLEYLASGTMNRHIASTYRISKQAFGLIIDEVCNAICIALKEEMPTTLSYEDWANDFHSKWNFPNCLGAIDGKHIRIKCPRRGRSLFFNYKGFHSIVMIAIVDANYRFLHVDVGGYGSEGDASYFSSSEVGQNIVDNNMNLPEDTTFNTTKIPYFFLADSGFPLCERVMTPFSHRGRTPTEEETIYNYRLSRARRCVENAFGILSMKWLCLSTTMFCKPDRAQKIVSACCLLHNFLLKKPSKTYCPKSIVDHYDHNGQFVSGSWREKSKAVFHDLSVSGIHREDEKAKKIRNLLKDYVNCPQGRLSWQRKSVFLK